VRDFDDEESVMAHLPWAQNEPCGDCPRTATGCKKHTLGMPRTVISGGPGPDDDLPCVGRWDLFDGDIVTPEAAGLCVGCSFQNWCFSTAVANNEQGIWAATTYEQRKEREAA
jgi:hypothetical protein